jgi:hypothetical protein
MHSRILIAATLAIAGFGAESANYDAERQGKLPPGWSAPANHKWEVRSDKSAPSHPNVLLGVSAGETQPPLALFDKVICLDGDLSVKFRIDNAQRGNAAGIVWRYQDPKNYYLLTLSADEKNVVLEKVRNGVPEFISTSAGRPAAAGIAEDIRPGQWHLVKVAFRGSKVHVFFGNRSLFTVEDSGILAPGKTGLWVKGSSGAAFDDFRIDKKG